MPQPPVHLKNRRALYERALIQKFSAGIKLTGAEVKAVREGGVKFEGSYVKITSVAVNETKKTKKTKTIKSLKFGQTPVKKPTSTKFKISPAIVGLHISPYSKQSQDVESYDPRRTRELLLTSDEIQKLTVLLDKKGNTAVPLGIYSKGKFLKMDVGVVKGLKDFEVKSVAKARQQARDLEREVKEMGSK